MFPSYHVCVVHLHVYDIDVPGLYGSYDAYVSMSALHVLKCLMFKCLRFKRSHVFVLHVYILVALKKPVISRCLCAVLQLLFQRRESPHLPGTLGNHGSFFSCCHGLYGSYDISYAHTHKVQSTICNYRHL